MIEQLKADMKTAMKAKERERLTVIRAILAAFTNELVAQGKSPTSDLSEEDQIKVMRKELKRRKEAASQFVDGGRQDLADNELFEATVIEAYLPQLMSKEEIEKVVDEALASQEGEINKGKFMGMLMGQLKGKADGTLVKEVVDEKIG